MIRSGGSWQDQVIPNFHGCFHWDSLALSLNILNDYPQPTNVQIWAQSDYHTAKITENTKHQAEVSKEICLRYLDVIINIWDLFGCILLEISMVFIKFILWKLLLIFSSLLKSCDIDFYKLLILIGFNRMISSKICEKYFRFWVMTTCSLHFHYCDLQWAFSIGIHQPPGQIGLIVIKVSNDFWERYEINQ